MENGIIHPSVFKDTHKPIKMNENTRSKVIDEIFSFHVVSKDNLSISDVMQIAKHTNDELIMNLISIAHYYKNQLLLKTFER